MGAERQYTRMNVIAHKIRTDWKIAIGKLKQQWAKLVNNELLFAEGEYD